VNKGPHIREMRTAFEEAKAEVDSNGVHMINFAKWVQFHTCMKNILRHELPDISDYRQSNAGSLAYLQSKLSAISGDSNTYQDLKTRSGGLLQQEKRIRRQGSRNQRLRTAIGF
jgi:hypothetical protein